MTQKTRTLLSMLLVFVLFAAVLPAQKKLDVSDDAISDMVRRKLANDPDVKGGRLTVEVKDGVVTLTGMVEQNRFKARAEKLTRKVKGVKSVNNQLTVGRAR